MRPHVAISDEAGSGSCHHMIDELFDRNVAWATGKTAATILEEG
jgi:hypothetical protein